MSVAEYGSLPFDEAIAFFRQKVNLPTEAWTDLQKGMHARAFVVAGATKDDLLSDLRVAVDKAIAQGTTLEEFRRDFDAIVKRTGWAYKGERGWRTRVILETNIRTAYSTGRYKQQTDPDVLATRPFLRYRHSDSVHPRPLHLSWDGLVVRADDPWLETHYPPNGWGCDCFMESVSLRDIRRDGKSGPDTPPDNGTVPWKNPATGEVENVPRGIDPGWNYNPGQAAWGAPLADGVADAWAAKGQDGWERLTPGDAASYGLPDEVPAVKPKAKVGRPARDKADLEQMITNVLGGPERAFEYPVGDFTHSINVNAKALADHLELSRGQFVPLIPEVLEKPTELWLSFERSKLDGKVVLRHRAIKVFDLGGKDRGVIVSAQSVKGQLEAWTVVPVRQLAYLQKSRVGKLLVKP